MAKIGLWDIEGELSNMSWCDDLIEARIKAIFSAVELLLRIEADRMEEKEKVTESE